MTADQKQMITDSLWVVNTLLIRYNRSNDRDLRQEAITYMCGCMQRFDPTRHIKWETYAFTSINLFLRRTISRTREKEKYTTYYDHTVIETVADKHNTKTNEMLALIYNGSTEKERRILDLLYQGYSRNEIATKLQLNISEVFRTIKKIKERAAMEKELKTKKVGSQEELDKAEEAVLLKLRRELCSGAIILTKSDVMTWIDSHLTKLRAKNKENK